MIICKDRFQREGIPQKIMCSLFAGDAIHGKGRRLLGIAHMQTRQRIRGVNIPDPTQVEY